MTFKEKGRDRYLGACNKGRDSELSQVKDQETAYLVTRCTENMQLPNTVKYISLGNIFN